MKKLLSTRLQSLPFHVNFRIVLSVMFLLVAKVSLADYTATFSPSNIPLNTPTLFSMTITSGVNQLGAIQITIPAGVTGPATTADVSVTPPAGSAWFVSEVTPTLISIRASGNGSANRLDVGESITVSFMVTITTAGSKFFTTQAFTNQNFEGGGVGVFTGPLPIVNETPSCPNPTNTLYVNSAVAVSGSGGSWACAIKELSDAVVAANGNLSIKAIWVAKGTYKPTTGADRNAYMLITRGDLKILGGFTSGAMSEAAANPITNATTISGDIGALGDASDNSYHTMLIRNVPATSPLVIDGFVFKSGNANGAGTLLGSGGAIFAYDNNVATTVTLSRCEFSNNNSLTYGGAIYTSRSNLSITGCIFKANSSTYGGAAFGYFSSPAISKTAFVNNTATSGAGFYSNFGSPVLNSCVFANNIASAEGGAVYQNQSSASYFNCLFANNTSEYSGAIHQLNTSSSIVVNSTFYGNAATNANGWGAGAILLGYNNCTTDVSNSIFYKNLNKGMDNVPNADIKNTYNTVNQVSYSMLQENSTVNTGAANTLGANPMFLNAASPVGGDAQWFTADDGLQLAAASPAINSGNNTPVGTYGLSTDLLGNTRIVCSTVDRGAIEYQPCNSPARTETTVQSKSVLENNVTGIVANPFSSDLQVRYNGTEKATLSVFDVSGKPSMNNRNISQGITHVDAANWSKGMYQVVIKTESGKQMIFKAMKF